MAYMDTANIDSRGAEGASAMRRPARALARVGPGAWGVTRDHAWGVHGSGGTSRYTLGGYIRGRGRAAAGARAGGWGTTSSSRARRRAGDETISRRVRRRARLDRVSTRLDELAAIAGAVSCGVGSVAAPRPSLPLPAQKLPKRSHSAPSSFGPPERPNRSSTRLRVPSALGPCRRSDRAPARPSVTEPNARLARRVPACGSCFGLSFVLASAQDQPLGAALGIIGIACGRILDGPHHELPASMMSECPTVGERGQSVHAQRSLPL